MYFGLMLTDALYGMRLRFTLSETEDLGKLKLPDDLLVSVQLNPPGTSHNEHYRVDTFQFHKYLD